MPIWSCLVIGIVVVYIALANLITGTGACASTVPDGEREQETKDPEHFVVPENVPGTFEYFTDVNHRLFLHTYYTRRAGFCFMIPHTFCPERVLISDISSHGETMNSYLAL